MAARSSWGHHVRIEGGRPGSRHVLHAVFCPFSYSFAQRAGPASHFSLEVANSPWCFFMFPSNLVCLSMLLADFLSCVGCYDWKWPQIVGLTFFYWPYSPTFSTQLNDSGGWTMSTPTSVGVCHVGQEIRKQENVIRVSSLQIPPLPAHHKWPYSSIKYPCPMATFSGFWKPLTFSP